MSWISLKINVEVSKVLTEKLGFDQPTQVQIKCIPEFENRKDVIVEAPTGSGKTLSYLVPVLDQLMKRETKLGKHQVGALVIVPNRELAIQVCAVLDNFLEPLHLTSITFIGGVKIDIDAEKFVHQGANIVVATPGRLDELYEQAVKNENKLFLASFKSLEVLILDEADRLFEKTFEKSLTSILEKLPKQKRVGLFSATQTEYEDELKKVSLRNPVKITVRAEAQNANSRTPVELENFYTVVDPFSKFAALIHFIRSHADEKILIFVSSCSCADYIGRLLNMLLNKTDKKAKYRKQLKLKEKTILTIHGKKRQKRAAIFTRFQDAASSCVLVCTDVMARGLDFSDVHWVVQYDLPRSTNFFLHRCGRTARSGHSGNALLFLLPSETDYVDYLKRNQHVTLKSITLTLEKGFAESVFNKIRKFALDDRSLLLKGTHSFVSFIQAYSKHDCGIVCQIKDLDVVNIAHTFGLLRLPKMPELRDRDLSGFRKCHVNTSEIKFKDTKVEKLRLEKKKLRQEQAMEAKNKKLRKSGNDLGKNNERNEENLLEKVKKRYRDEAEVEGDYKLIKKLKKGKISKNKFDEQFLS